MQLSSEEMLTLQLRRRSFQLALADLRVQGALIATTPGSMPDFAVCPCCGYPTLASRGAYDSCFICSWEDDNQDNATADQVRGGPNGDYSLTEARRNFIDHHTQYRPSDPRYTQQMRAATERERIIDAFGALLPNVEPWAFIGALPRIVALETRLYERQFGKRKVRRWHQAEQDDRRRADREWEIWQAVAEGTLPHLSWWPPSVQSHTARVFNTIASQVTDLLDVRMGQNAPTVAHRNTGYCCWSSGERSAWLTHYAYEALLGLMFEPYAEGGAEPKFRVDDERTVEEIARCLGEFFTAAEAPSA